MTAPSLRSHIADVLRPELDSGCVPDVDPLADALLADPTLAAIIDLAAEYLYLDHEYGDEDEGGTPEVRALLAAWRAER